MSKKDYVILLLNMLEKEWPPAKGIKILLLNNRFSNEDIDYLAEAIQTEIKAITNQALKNKFQKSLDYLEKLKKIESTRSAKEKQELDSIKNILNNL